LLKSLIAVDRLMSVTHYSCFAALRRATAGRQISSCSPKRGHDLGGGDGQQLSPCHCRRDGNSPASSSRLDVPVLAIALWMWFSTVRTHNVSRVAISRLDRPCPISITISRSRSVSGSRSAALRRVAVRAPHCSANASALAEQPNADP